MIAIGSFPPTLIILCLIFRISVATVFAATFLLISAYFCRKILINVYVGAKNFVGIVYGIKTRLVHKNHMYIHIYLLAKNTSDLFLIIMIINGLTVEFL